VITIQNFLGSIKVEVVAAGIKYTRLLEATDCRLHTAGGWAVSQLIEALDRGVHAFMPTGMHEIYVAIDRAHRRGERETARRIFNRLTPTLAFSNQHLDVSILFFKRLLSRQGVYPTARCRSPRLAFDRYHERVADELIDEVIQLTAELRESA
jgi:4-hydroxy-tetrahydrodipicolinate synthase